MASDVSLANNGVPAKSNAKSDKGMSLRRFKESSPLGKIRAGPGFAWALIASRLVVRVRYKDRYTVPASLPGGQNLSGNVDVHLCTPRRQQSPQNRTRPRDALTVDFAHTGETVRRAGQHGFVGHKTVSDAERPFFERDPKFPT